MTIAFQIAAGLVSGYVIVTISESFFHRTIQHASPALRRWYAKAGRIGRALRRAWYSHHVVHHFLTFRENHVTQFRDEEEQWSFASTLKEKGMTDIVACDYGTRLGNDPINYLHYVAPTLPFLIVACAFGGRWFTLGAVLPFCVWPMLAQFIHPYLHRPYEEVLRRAPPVTRLIARTSYFRFLARHHWLHHRYTDCNYNLLLGGDYLLGVHRAPSGDDLDAMRAIGLAVPSPCVSLVPDATVPNQP